HSDLNFVIRGRDSSLLSSAYRETLRTFAPDTPVFDLVSLQQHMMESISADRIIASLSGFLGLLALLLTSISLYGHVAWSVTERIWEIGIRRALGATRSGIVGMMCGGLVVPLAIGLAVGLGGAVAISRALSSLLYNTPPADPVLILSSIACMLTAAVFASF